MPVAANSIRGGPKTKHATKRVFMRAEKNDNLNITEITSEFIETPIPATVTVIQRLMTYYGPKLRIQADDEQFLLTAPGPDVQAYLWRQNESGWEQAAEVCLEFADSIPQYDFCLKCGEPLSTITHERQAAIGTCSK